MSLDLRFNIQGEKQLARRFRGISANLKDFKPEFQKSGDMLKDFFGKDVFQSEGRAIQEPWAKRDKNYAWPILQKTGRMKGSFRNKASAMQAEITNRSPYFKYHQSNASRSSNLPRRIMMKITNPLKNKIVRIFTKGISNKIRKNV